MPKTKTVVVDASKLTLVDSILGTLENCATHNLWGDELCSPDDAVTAREALAPIVPVLPEGWEVNSSGPDGVFMSSTGPAPDVVKASITPRGRTCYFWASHRAAQMPHDVAAYLLHAWGMR